MKERRSATMPSGEALLHAARRLLDSLPPLDKERLLELARLMLLRRACLEMLRARLSLPDDPREWLGRARQGGCPLFQPEPPELSPAEADELVLGLPPPTAADIDEFYQQLLELDISLRGRKKKSVTLTAGRGRRRRQGLFFTPGWLAERLAAWVVGEEGPAPAVVLDPACGSGRLLWAVAERLLARRPNVEERAQALRELVRTRLCGVELDPLAAALCRTRFWLAADPNRGPLVGLTEMVTEGDAIGGRLDGSSGVDWPGLFARRAGGQPGFEALVVNPPFEVLTRFGRRPGQAEYAARLRRAGYRLALRGNLHTQRLFLERCLELLGPGGRLAIIMPLSFLTDQTASPLRAHLLREGWLRSVEVFAESQRAFTGVNQAVLWLAIEKKRGSGRLRIQNGERVEHKLEYGWIEALDPEGLPLPVASAEAVALAARMKHASRGCFADIAEGRVGEVDQTIYRRFMLSAPGEALLVRGEHLSPYRVDLDPAEGKERWLDREGFLRARGKGSWRQGLGLRRVVQTGIVNLEAKRRLVAALVPPGVFLGNSVNWWRARLGEPWPEEIRLGYLLGLLNSLPYEWRFRLTSSNNNINLYEVKALPLPPLEEAFPTESIPGILQRALEVVESGRGEALTLVRQITAGWGAPARNDRAAAMLIGRLAWRRWQGNEAVDYNRLERVLDHLVNWHLGLDEPDLERMAGWLESRSVEKRRPGDEERSS